MTRPSGTGEATPASPRTGDLETLLLPKDRQPRRATAVAALRAMSWRSMLKIKHIPSQLFDVTLFPIVMVLMFTYLFGGAIAGSTDEYLQYLLPGIMTMSVLLTTLSTGMTINIDAKQGLLDRVRTLSIWRPAPMIGYLVADAFRYTSASLVMVVVGLVLGYRPAAGVLGVLAGIGVLVGFAFAFSWVWTALGLVLDTEKAVMSVSMAVMFPLTFLSNVLVDPDTMPGWLGSVVEVSPVTQLVTSVRGLTSGVWEGAALLWTTVYGAGFLVLFGALTIRLYNRQ
ncbi:ABC-2 type transport system permease protein [Prauserella shujinwangii]|uniref:Transport permease protein n=1 Tax=Prauserella shujinwangii TaxID=1453103 RepID=A0A2T0M3Z5_9PSEU|nr:ABC transporter permease [Prauserella shujinwangii]PRX51446.1 ABC-2 type transport system permease protein [Prauserella shujinwangii]